MEAVSCQIPLGPDRRRLTSVPWNSTCLRPMPTETLMMKIEGKFLEKFEPHAPENKKCAEMLKKIAKGYVLHQLRSSPAYADLFKSTENHSQADESMDVAWTMAYVFEDLLNVVGQHDQLTEWLDVRSLAGNPASSDAWSSVYYRRCLVFVWHVTEVKQTCAPNNCIPPYYTDITSLKLGPAAEQALRVIEPVYNAWRTGVNEALSLIRAEDKQ